MRNKYLNVVKFSQYNIIKYNFIIVIDTTYMFDYNNRQWYFSIRKILKFASKSIKVKQNTDV